MVLKTEIKTKSKPKAKTKQKIKQKQIQKQSQKVIVNIHETKKKQITRRKPNKKNDETETNNGPSAVYAIPDNRAIDTLRGELVNTQNKLLSLTNTPNMVNQNSDIESIKNNLRGLSEEGNRFFGDIYNRLGGIEGNKRTFINPYKQEEEKFYKSNIGENIPSINVKEYKTPGRKPGTKNKPKEQTIQTESTRELRSKDKEPQKEESKSFIIDPDDEIIMQQQMRSEAIRKRIAEKRIKEEQLKAEKKAMEEKEVLEEKKVSQRKATKATKTK
jgi:hypothetical protein